MSASEPVTTSDGKEPPTEPVADSRSRPMIRERIEFLASFRNVFLQPDWFKNLLIFSAFTLIPVLNTAITFGYLFEITEHLHRRRSGPYPLFEVRRFADYVTRGIWCYLILQMVAVIVAPIIQVLIQGTTFGSLAIARSNEQVAAIVLAIVVPLVATAFFLFLLGLAILLSPFYLRAGLTQDFALTFNFRWVADYIRKMWLELLLVNVFLILSMFVLLPLGCLTFCFGFLVAGALITMASGHLHWQLYELYLSRGGEPIPLKTDVHSSTSGHPPSASVQS